MLRLLRDGDWPTTDDAPTPVDTGRPRRRTRRWPAVAAGALALAAAATTTVALTGDDSAPGNLPAGWTAWHKQAKDPSVDKAPLGAGAPFNRCVAAGGTSLVCAGDEVLATRFALADGRNTWSLPIDATADDIGSSSSSGGGTIIGTRDGRVYAYGSDDRAVGADDDGSTAVRYTIQSLDAETGKVIWKTVTGDGEETAEPSSDQGASTAVTEGVITTYGKRGSSSPCSAPTTARSAGGRSSPTRTSRSACCAARPGRDTWSARSGTATTPSATRASRSSTRPPAVPAGPSRSRGTRTSSDRSTDA